MQDQYDLRRFVAAQDHDSAFIRALAELRQGKKTSHWMWFVFPQIAGLGRSATAQKYAISGLAEAEAYLSHKLLGDRLKEATQIVAAANAGSADELFGPIDTNKLHSSMTLFARVAVCSEFSNVIDRFFGGLPDVATDAILADQSSAP